MGRPDAADAGADGDGDANADGGAGDLVRGVPMAGSVLGKKAAGFQEKGKELMSGRVRCGALVGLAGPVQPKIWISVRVGDRGDMGL